MQRDSGLSLKAPTQYHAGMTNLVGTYRFTRDPVAGFFAQNTASTDALNVLVQWVGIASERTYIPLEDVEEHLIARVTFPSSDRSAAARDMDRLCQRHGVQREPLDGCPSQEG